MTKEILLTIAGFQKDMDRDDLVEQVVKGEYYYRNGKHYIFYEEIYDAQEDPTPTKCRIVITDHTVEVVRKGGTNNHLFFEKDKKTTTSYLTPFGQILTSFFTYDLLVEETEDTIKLNLRYELEMYGEFVSDCEIRLNVNAIR